MRRPIRLAPLLLAAGVSWARAGDVPAPPALPPTVKLDLAAAPAGSSQLPLKLPGYELRVLADRKLLYFDVAGSWVEIPLPILFYFPTADRAGALRLLRGTADTLRALGERADSAPPDTAALAAQLDRAAALLDP